jgi:hypothetical protein
VTFKEMFGYVGLALALLLVAVLGGMVYTGTYMIPQWPQQVRGIVLIVPAAGVFYAFAARYF